MYNMYNDKDPLICLYTLRENIICSCNINLNTFESGTLLTTYQYLAFYLFCSHI